MTLRRMHLVVLLATLALVGVRSADQARGEIPSSGVRFVSEVVAITAESDSVRVDGLYRLAFAEAAAGSVTLVYPYPRDQELGGARTEVLHWRPLGRGEEAWRPLPVRELPRSLGCRWRLPAVPGGEVEVATTYRQCRLADYARYIVTTTASWPRPLEHARFVVRLPAGAEPTEFSFPFVACEGRERGAWCYEAESFAPDRDVTVRWR
jgi:hypothetical protein